VPAFRDGRDTPRHYLEVCLARIAALEPHVHAFAHLDVEAARHAADASTRRYRRGTALSAIDGMPVGVKDIIDTRDMPTQMNSAIFAGFQPRRDAACVLALRDAGAVIVGKTVTTEFAFGRSGPTHNPFDPSRTPGGSSSGSAAAVGAGMLPAALGTQTLGSIVRPASYCGAFGWKPTRRAISTEGVAPLSSTLDHVGVIAHAIGDAWVLAMAIAGQPAAFESAGHPPGQLPEARKPARLVKLETPAWAETDDASKAPFEDALRALGRAGIEIRDRADPRVDAFERELLAARDVAMTILAWESQWPLRAYQAAGADAMGPRLRELIDAASRMTRHDYEAALRRRADLARAVSELSAGADGFVTLSSSGPAPPGLDETGSRLFQVAWSLVGAPSCSLPVLRVAGLPLGLQLMGLPARDAQMLATARWVIDYLLG
jgi:Asp-tRNA(Asn)/Glu-tRNA(Gln) amidotransferase A subunit family amidase